MDCMIRYLQDDSITQYVLLRLKASFTIDMFILINVWFLVKISDNIDNDTFSFEFIMVVV